MSKYTIDSKNTFSTPTPYETKQRDKFVAELDKLIEEEESTVRTYMEQIEKQIRHEPFKKDYVDAMIWSAREHVMIKRGLTTMKNEVINKTS